MAPGDNEIIQSVLKGDQALYAQLVKRYQHFVFTIALRYTPNREDAEEIAQDVFVKAYRSLADFRGESKFSTWLYTIVTTTCITFLRKKKVTIHSLDNEQVFEMADNRADFVSLLFSRKRPAGLDGNSSAKDLFQAIAEAKPDPQLYAATLKDIKEFLKGAK